MVGNFWRAEKSCKIIFWLTFKLFFSPIIFFVRILVPTSVRIVPGVLFQLFPLLAPPAVRIQDVGVTVQVQVLPRWARFKMSD